MGTLIWLHLSDLHFDRYEDPYNRNVVLKPLLQKLEELASSEWVPEVVFFTGDIANTGGGHDPKTDKFPEYEAGSRVLPHRNADN